MDWLGFTSSVVASVVWPVAVVLLLIVMRKPIQEMLLSLHQLRASGLGGSIEAEFTAKMAILQERAAQEAIPAPETRQPDRIAASIGDLEKRHLLADLSPRGAILESWLTLEDVVRELDEALYPNTGVRKWYSGITLTLERLEQQGRISPGLLSILRDLRQLRNQAVHAGDQMLSADVAHQYIDTLDQALQVLSRLSR